MAPTRITVEGVGGVKLSTDAGLDWWLANKKVQCLIDVSDGYQVADFGSLVDGGTYTLGPPQQRQSSKRARTDDDDDAENESLRKRILALEMQDSRAVSYADYFHERYERGRVRQQWVPVIPVDCKLPTILCGQLPQGGEKEIVKPYWQGVVEHVKLVSDHSNGYEVGYLGSKIPDVAFYPSAVVKPTAREFVAFGDCKGSNWTGTSAAEKGQMMQYGHRILDAQPQISHVYGFITNNSQVLLICAQRSNERPFGIFWNISPVMTFQHGMKAFFYLLEHHHGYVTPPTVLGSPLAIRRPLRPGGTCRAFEAIYREKEVVAKLYKDPD